MCPLGETMESFAILTNGEGETIELCEEYGYEPGDHEDMIGIKVNLTWCSSYIKFHVSKDRLYEFKSIYELDGENFSFSNEDGNIFMEISNGTTGSSLIRGSIMNNINEESRLEFVIRSDRQSIDSFARDVVRHVGEID